MSLSCHRVMLCVIVMSSLSVIFPISHIPRAVSCHPSSGVLPCVFHVLLILFSIPFRIDLESVIQFIEIIPRSESK